MRSSRLRYLQAGNKYIETSAQEVSFPDGFQNKRAPPPGFCAHWVVSTSPLLSASGFHCTHLQSDSDFIVEGIGADRYRDSRLEHGGIFGSAQENIDRFQQQFFNTEWLGDVIIGANGKSMNFILFQTFCRQEYDRHLLIARFLIISCAREWNPSTSGNITSRMHRSNLAAFLSLPGLFAHSQCVTT